MKRFLFPLTPRATKNFKSSIDTFQKHEKNVRLEVDICHKIEAKLTNEMLQADRKREMEKSQGVFSYQCLCVANFSNRAEVSTTAENNIAGQCERET